MRKRLVTTVALALAIATTALATGGPATAATSLSPSQRLTRLYQLQVAFHRAASVHNPDGPDSAAMIDRRIKQMLSLWTADGSLTLSAVTPAREFKGKGELGTASCAPGAGTLCDFFKNVAGSFRPQARLVSLSPSYKTHFKLQGDTALVYFECHYFNIAPPATAADPPLWKDVAHLVFNGTAKWDRGRWLFVHAEAPAASVPFVPPSGA